MSERDKIWWKLLGLMLYTAAVTSVAGGGIWLFFLAFPPSVFISYWADELARGKDEQP